MSSKWPDSSEHLNSSGEVAKLQREIEQLQQDNKVLHIRAQGVQVLGKVLQDSQESNARLQKEVHKLKADLAHKGIDSQLADLSVCTSIDDDSQSIVEQGERYRLSPPKSDDNHDYVNITTVSEPQSLSSGFPSLLPGDFHIKEIQAEFQHITSELDQLMTSAQKLSENIEGLPGNERDTELQGKLTRLNSKLNEYVKEARTRETLSSALLSEEEKLKTKLIAMEAEQASHENVVQQLKDKIDRSREEIEEIQGEVKFFKETVVVKREQEPTAVGRNEPLSIGSERSTTRSTSDESLIRKTPLSRTDSEACETCSQYQRQLSELQRLLLLAKAEKDEALKLKEEILDVNHKWDAQYKMLSSASSKEIADLQNQLKMLHVKFSDSSRNPEIMEKKALEDRCKELESELQHKQLEINHMQLLMRDQSALKYQQPPAPQHTSMEQPLSHLSLLGASAPRPGTPTRSLPSWPGTTAYGQQIPAELVDQIEVLKQQLRVYADDFATEREDRERNQAEKEKLREELDVVKEQLQTLEQQVQIYEEDFKREKREKESLQQQLRAKNSGVVYQYQNPLELRARAVAEQEARVQAIREVHDREKERLLRGRQELQQQVYGHQPYSRIQTQYNPYGVSGLEYTTPEWQRQNYPLAPRGAVPPRGPIAHPASQRSIRPSMYHGGEVQPDNDMVEDVVDSPADGNDADATGVSDDDEKVVGLEECPRCLRKFDGEDSNAVLKHIERCIS